MAVIGARTRKGKVTVAKFCSDYRLVQLALQRLQLRANRGTKKRRYQTKSNQSPKFLTAGPLGCQLTPLSRCRGAVLLEGVAAVEVAILIEVIVDRGVNGGELLQGLDVPESCPSLKSG
jgi:hypothetical protein